MGHAIGKMTLKHNAGNTRKIPGNKKVKENKDENI